VELRGEGAKDLGHHDVVQSSPIDGWIGDVGDDVAVKGIVMKRKKHEVASLLVVGRRGLQNNHDHQSYVLEAGSLRMQVLSYSVFMPKPSTHCMCALDQLFHTYGPKAFIDNQMSRIKYIYYINNVSKD
jgi:hypothetical protein